MSESQTNDARWWYDRRRECKIAHRMLEYRRRRDPSSLTYHGARSAKLTVLDCCTLPTCAAPRSSAFMTCWY